MVFLIIRKQTQNRHQLNQLNGILLLNNEGLKLQHISYTLNVQQKNKQIFVEFEITVEEEIVPLAIFKGHNGQVHENGSMPLHLRSLSISSDQQGFQFRSFKDKTSKKQNWKHLNQISNLKKKTHPTSKEQK